MVASLLGLISVIVTQNINPIYIIADSEGMCTINCTYMASMSELSYMNTRSVLNIGQVVGYYVITNIIIISETS